MNDHKNHTVLVVDLGLFPELAITLTASFRDVFYYTPGIHNQCQKRNPVLVGTGMPGVVRVDHIDDVLRGVPKQDLLILYPDLTFGPEQVRLREEGYRVWGAAKAEELEQNRAKTKKHFEKIGIPLAPYVVLRGVEQLREYVKRHPDVWVKISTFRGDFETFHAETYSLARCEIDKMAYVFGTASNEVEIIVEKSVPDAVETSSDTFSIDGEYPNYTVAGYEAKDRGYFGTFIPYASLPKPIIDNNLKIAPTLKRYNCRSWTAMETRITRDGKGYVIDPCMRMGFPVCEVVQMLYKNLPDIFWYGAEGQMVHPVCTEEGRYAAEVVLTSQKIIEDRLNVYIPEKVRKQVKLQNFYVHQGEYYILPQPGSISPFIGAVVAIGKTKEEAINKVKGYAKLVKGLGVTVEENCFDEIEETQKKFKSFGYTL